MESWRLRRICWRVTASVFDWKCAMTSLKAKLGILVAGLMLSGCMQTTSYQAAPGGHSQAGRQGPACKGALRQGCRGRAVPPRHRRLSPQGRAGLDRRQFRQPLSLLRAGRRQGDPLRHHRRRGSDELVGHRQGRHDGRMASLAPYARRNPAHGGRSIFRAARPGQSDGLARHVSLLRRQGRHAVPYPRHQPAGIYRCTRSRQAASA